MMSRLFDGLRRLSWWEAIGVGLVIALLLTALGRWAATRYVAEHAEAEQQQGVQATLSTVDARFESLRDQALGRAQQLATDSTVIGALKQWRETGERSASLLRYVSDLSLQDHTTV